jgi:WD40 repeat protein
MIAGKPGIIGTFRTAEQEDKFHIDHIVAAGSDGLPKVYLIFREVKREIGDDAQFIGDLFPINGRVFSARFSADGKRIACGGGLDRTGEIVIASYDFTNDVPKELRQLMGKVPGARNADEQKRLDEYKKSGIREVARIAVPQSAIYSVALTPDGAKVAAAGSDGIVRLFNAADGKPIKEFASVPFAKAAIVQSSQSNHIDFIRDVSPVISRLGCNAGTCHGAKEGKSGFKLSLRGYDPETDLRALTDDLASRRVNLASPDDSLMLLKAIAEVPHEGGRRTTIDNKYYKILRQWIAEGANLDMKSPRVVKIQVSPQNPVVESVGAKQPFSVVATYADSTTRDVTAEAFVESGNTDVATADGPVLTTLRRGEAPVLARYEGNYAATTLTVMGDRTGFVWQEPPAWGKIDELVAAKPRHEVLRPQHLAQTVGDRAQQLVAAGMAERVVDLLELVEVDEQQRR